MSLSALSLSDPITCDDTLPASCGPQKCKATTLNDKTCGDATPPSEENNSRDLNSLSSNSTAHLLLHNNQNGGNEVDLELHKQERGGTGRQLHTANEEWISLCKSVVTEQREQRKLRVFENRVLRVGPVRTVPVGFTQDRASQTEALDTKQHTKPQEESPRQAENPSACAEKATQTESVKSANGEIGVSSSDSQYNIEWLLAYRFGTESTLKAESPPFGRITCVPHSSLNSRKGPTSYSAESPHSKQRHDTMPSVKGNKDKLGDWSHWDRSGRKHTADGITCDSSYRNASSNCKGGLVDKYGTHPDPSGVNTEKETWRIAPGPNDGPIIDQRHPSERRQQKNEEEQLTAEFKSLLNKITIEKFERVAEQIAAVASNARGTNEVSIFANLIFDKGISEPVYAGMYGDLCLILRWRTPVFPREGPNEKDVSFHRIFLNRCQDEFEKLQCRDAVEVTKQEGEQLDEDGVQGLLRRKKLRVLGNMKFIGELYLRKILATKVVCEVVNGLVFPKSHGNSAVSPGGNVTDDPPQEYFIECLTELLSTIGYTLDATEGGSLLLDNYMDKLKQLQRSSVYSNRIMFRIQDLLDLREHKWRCKVFKETAKSVAQIRQDALNEERRGGSIVVAQEGMFLTKGQKAQQPYAKYVEQQRAIYHAKRAKEATESVEPQPVVPALDAKGNSTTDSKSPDRHSDNAKTRDEESREVAKKPPPPPGDIGILKVPEMGQNPPQGNHTGAVPQDQLLKDLDTLITHRLNGRDNLGSIKSSWMTLVKEGNLAIPRYIASVAQKALDARSTEESILLGDIGGEMLQTLENESIFSECIQQVLACIAASSVESANKNLHIKGFANMCELGTKFVALRYLVDHPNLFPKSVGIVTEFLRNYLSQLAKKYSEELSPVWKQLHPECAKCFVKQCAMTEDQAISHINSIFYKP